MNTMMARIQYAGGDQLGRINKQKLRSFQWALKNNYQTRYIKTELNSSWPCLINMNASGLKSDYDKKYISIEFDSGLQAGDTFEMLDDGTHWMVYIPILTETAYLRSEIIRCRYELELEGRKYWIYFQGPTETDLRWFQKKGVNVNELNLSGTIYIKNDEFTKEYFKRFTHIKIDGHMWEVQVTDPITVPGILELEVQEYYDNFVEELPPVVPEKDSISQILGDKKVRQDTVNGYEIESEYYNPKYVWKVFDNDRVELAETLLNGRICKVKVHPGAIKTYKVYYGPENGNGGYSIEVSIDISKSQINGDEEVYPYDIKEYAVKSDGIFWVETKLAKVTQTESTKCSVEILSGKKGGFTLYCKDKASQEVYELPIKIKSF